MSIINFKHHINKDLLAGLIVRQPDDYQLPQCIYIHGGGPSSYKERIFDLAKPFLDNNQNILSFEFNGHGESSGTISEGSLAQRVTRAQSMINHYAAKQHLTLIGASMGGYISIKLLELFPVDTLILMCPAIYDAKACTVPFNQGFTEIIRSFESWRNTDALTILEQFKGKLLVIMGTEDEVIPPGVIDLIMHHSSKAGKKELYYIPGCPHKMHDWLKAHPQELNRLHKKIAEFIS